MKIRAYGSKALQQKFTWCFRKAKQVYLYVVLDGIVQLFIFIPNANAAST